MNLCRIETVEDMKVFLTDLFFTDHIGHPDLSYEETEEFLEVSFHDYTPDHIEYDSDDFFEFIDNFASDDLKKWAVDEGNSPLVRDFKPCHVVYDFRNEFDRYGGVYIRQFCIFEKCDTKFKMCEG